MFQISIVFLLLQLTFISCNGPIVTIPVGTLKGQYRRTLNGNTFSSFTGIPYAQPPVGKLRFQAPKPALPWNGILDATRPHLICTQSNIYVGDNAVQGDEDCLYLNIYTPLINYTTTSQKQVPVMMYIHGGGLLTGNGGYRLLDPRLLLDKTIVLVVINYRLGPLGFFSTRDEVVPGNNGLKDQNMALRWIKSYIHFFGGNANKITVFGQSSGAASAHLHMLSPLSKDLVNGVICQSGSALAPWAISPNDQNLRNSRTLAHYFNCSYKTNYKMVECLRKVDAYKITKFQDEFYEWDWHPLTPFKPVIEPNIPGAFLSEHPVEIIKSRKSANVPFMIGMNTEDGAVVSSSIYGKQFLLEQYNQYFDRIAPVSLLYSETTPYKDYITTSVREFYFGNKEIDESLKPQVTNLYTDRLFLSGTNNALRLHLQYSTQPLYNYAFGYRGTYSYSVIYGDSFSDYGVCHRDEMLYLFLNPRIFPFYVPISTDRKMVNIMTTLWVNFARTGNPTPTTSHLIPNKWENVRSDSLEYYNIRNATDIHMSKRLYKERDTFWRRMPTYSAVYKEVS